MAKFNTTLPALVSGAWADLQLSNDGRLLTASMPIRTAVVQQNLTIAIANTAQVALAANTNRNGFEVYNPSGFTLYLSIGGTAVVGAGIPIVSNGSYGCTGNSVSTAAISIVAASLALNFTVIEY